MHNILAGHGPVFNPGEYVEGFTSPLWLVLLTVGALVMPVEVAAKVLGVGLGLLTLTMVAMLGQQIQLAGGRIPAPGKPERGANGEPFSLPAWICMAPLCLNFCFIYWSVAGLDTILTTFWFTLATWSIYRFVHDGSPIVCGLLVGATPWVRPEGMVFVLLASLVVLAVGDRGPRFRRYLLCAATPVVLLLLIRWSVYGDLLPNTYYAKGRCGLSAIPMALKYLRPMAYLWALPLQVLSAFLGLAWLFAHRRIADLLVLSPAILTVLALVLQSGGDWMAFLRFVVPAFPVLSLLLGLGIWTTARRLGDRPVRVAWVAIYTSLLCVGTIDAARGWSDSRHPCDRRREGFSRAGEPSGSNQNRSVATAVVRRWTNGCANHVKSGQTIAFGDVGYVPYTNPDVRFLDLNGLTSYKVAHLTNENSNTGPAGWGGEIRADHPLGKLIRELQPDYIIPRSGCSQFRENDEILDGEYRAVAILFSPDSFWKYVIFRRTATTRGDASEKVLVRGSGVDQRRCRELSALSTS